MDYPESQLSSTRTPCIVGIGTTRFGDLYRSLDPNRTSYQLGMMAFAEAVHECGIDKAAIDGVIVARIPSYIKLCADLGLRDLSFVHLQASAGFQSGLALLEASMLIQTGQATTVACIYGNNGRSVRWNYGGEPTETSADADLYGMTSNGAYLGMSFRRHSHEFGTPVEALGTLAVSTRSYASHNENAIMRDPITLDDYFASRYVADPLRLLDYCLVNDGGVAYIVTSLERARELAKPPVRVLGSATAGSMQYYYVADDYWYSTLRGLSSRLFGRAGVTVGDLDLAQIYDNFTPSVLFALEGIGVCEQGESGPWILEGNTRPDGKLPLNTSGGQLSEAYLQGWALTVEAVRQLRGEAGERQIPGASLALDLIASPVCTGHILAKE